MSTEVTISKADNLRNLLSDYKIEISQALPKHVSPDRIVRIALSSVRKNPELLECDPLSFLGAVIQSSQLGLEPDTPLGHSYLVPFRNGRTGKKEVNFMTGYRGLMDLVYRLPDHPVLMPVAVYEGDKFEYELGLKPKLVHVPMPRPDKSKLTHVYCTASFKDGRREFMVMSRPEIEEIRLRSKATGFSPWKTDYEAMAFKTVIRRIVKYLPMSAEVSTAINLDDLADVGKTQHNDLLLKPESAPIQTKKERITERFDPDFDK